MARARRMRGGFALAAMAILIAAWTGCKDATFEAGDGGGGADSALGAYLVLSQRVPVPDTTSAGIAPPAWWMARDSIRYLQYVRISAESLFFYANPLDANAGRLVRGAPRGTASVQVIPFFGHAWMRIRDSVAAPGAGRPAYFQFDCECQRADSAVSG